MKTVQLGKTGESVSALCLGTALFVEDAAAFPLLDAYAEAGGSFLDTSNIYGKHVPGHYGGEGEALIGRWISARGNRGKMFVATKVGVAYPPGPGMPAVPSGVSRRQLIDECDKSLSRLRIDTIDLYYLHNDFRATPMEEVMQTLHDLVRQGKVRHLGASSHAAWRLEEARGTATHRKLTPFCCVQERHTYLRPKPGAVCPTTRYADVEIKDWCKTHGASLLAYSPLVRGAYVRNDRPLPEQYRGADADVRLRVLNEVASAKNCSANQVVLAWMMQDDPGFIPLITGSRAEHIRENLGALDVRLDADEMQRLNSASM